MTTPRRSFICEMKRRMGYVDEPDESLMEQRTKLKPAASADEPKTVKEAVEAFYFDGPKPARARLRLVRDEVLALG